MNFYKRYPADYARKTARLSLVQHGAYCLLLDEVYTSEGPLPAAYDELYRICRAMSKAEQTAVQIVADKFFPVDADGLRHNSRADEEIEEAAPAIEAARANGKKGGRPRKETQQEPSGFPKHNPDETQKEPSSKPPQSLDNSPSLRSGEKRASAPSRPDDVEPQTWDDWLQLRKGHSAKVSVTALDGARKEAVKAGLTLQRFLEVWCLRGSRGLQADWLKPHELRGRQSLTEINHREGVDADGHLI